MQISAAIIEKSFVHHISANIAYNSTNKVSRPMFSGSTIINIIVQLQCSYSYAHVYWLSNDILFVSVALLIAELLEALL